MISPLFSARRGPILVEAEVSGPARGAQIKLVLDTGATTTLINLTTLLYLGFDPSQPLRLIRMTTGSTVEIVPLFVLTRLSALGQHRYGFPVIAHALQGRSTMRAL